MQRVAALPRQALLGVVGRPHVERRQRIDSPPVGDGEVRGHFGPGPDAHPVGLHDVLPAVQCLGVGLAVGPDTLLERPGELGSVGFADEIGPLVIERRVQEEAFVIELEVLLGFTNAALAERQQLLALGERPHSDGPFFESNRHRERKGTTLFVENVRVTALQADRPRDRRDCREDGTDRKTYLHSG